MVSVVLAVVALRFNPRGHFWLAVEPPKAQGEAYDPAKLRTALRANEDIFLPASVDRLVREPQDTWSNLGYAATGLAILLAARTRLGRSVGWACVGLAISSGMYHASLLPEWRLIDILGVYAALFTTLIFCIAAMTRWPSARNEGIIVVATWLAAILAGVHRNDVRWGGFKPLDSTTIVVGAMIVGLGVTLLARQRVPAERRSRYHATLAVGLLGAVVSIIGGLGDRFGSFWCNPEALIQGHAVWHLGGALALTCTYEIAALTGAERSLLDA